MKKAYEITKMVLFVALFLGSTFVVVTNMANGIESYSGKSSEFWGWISMASWLLFLVLVRKAIKWDLKE